MYEYPVQAYIGTEQGDLYTFSLKDANIRKHSKADANALFAKPETECKPKSLKVIRVNEEDQDKVLMVFDNFGVIIFDMLKNTAIHRIKINGVKILDALWDMTSSSIILALVTGLISIISFKNKQIISKTDIEVCNKAIKRLFLMKHSNENNLLISLTSNNSNFIITK